MKRTTTTIALLAALAAPSLVAAPAFAQDGATMSSDEKAQKKSDEMAQKVWDRYVDAAYGEIADDPSKLKNITQKGRREMAAMGLSMPMEMTIVPNEGMIMTMEIPNIDTYTIGVYQGNAWGKSIMEGARVMEGQEAEQFLFQSDFVGSMDWRTYNESIEYMGSETVTLMDDTEVEVEVVAFDPVNSDSLTTQYFSKETGLLVKSETSITLPGGAGEAPATMYFSDYREVGGMNLPFNTTTVLGPNEIGIIFEEVLINQDLDEDVLTPPQDILDQIED